ncbi:MAG: hypothetical protein ACJ75J_03900, partial [Cytophagaceae bacterium]
LIISCKKKKEDPTPAGPTCSNLLTNDTITYSGSQTGTEYRKYIYNASKQLTKIEYTYSPSLVYSAFDTIIYNGGKIDSVNTYNIGNSTPKATNAYMYTSGILTSVSETGSNSNGAFVRTRTYTYTSGKISAMTVAYGATGSAGSGPENFNNIVFTNGNISSADLGASFGGTATVVSDVTAPNPFLGLNNDPTDIVAMFSANNPTSAYSNLAPGSPFFTRTYTYANGRVKTMTETGGSSTAAHVYTYTCL